VWLIPISLLFPLSSPFFPLQNKTQLLKKKTLCHLIYSTAAKITRCDKRVKAVGEGQCSLWPPQPPWRAGGRLGACPRCLQSQKPFGVSESWAVMVAGGREGANRNTLPLPWCRWGVEVERAQRVRRWKDFGCWWREMQAKSDNKIK